MEWVRRCLSGLADRLPQRLAARFARDWTCCRRGTVHLRQGCQGQGRTHLCSKT